MFVFPKLKISVTAEPIEFCYSGNKPSGLVVVLGYFLGTYLFFYYHLGPQPLVVRGETASLLKK